MTYLLEAGESSDCSCSDELSIMYEEVIMVAVQTLD